MASRTLVGTPFVIAVARKQVVTCFLERQGRILLLRRSSLVSSYQGRWAGVSGYVEHTPDAQSLIEIGEEIGLSPNEVTLVSKGPPLVVDDAETGMGWIVHPYLYRTLADKAIMIDWEHDMLCWIKPQEMVNFDTVPGLHEAFLCVYDPETS